MVCAAKVGDTWHRCTIASLPGHKQVSVYLVDFGTTEIVSWDCVRVLNEEFVKINAQVRKTNFL